MDATWYKVRNIEINRIYKKLNVAFLMHVSRIFKYSCLNIHWKKILYSIGGNILLFKRISWWISKFYFKQFNLYITLLLKQFLSNRVEGKICFRRNWLMVDSISPIYTRFPQNCIHRRERERGTNEGLIIGFSILGAVFNAQCIGIGQVNLVYGSMAFILENTTTIKSLIF